MKQGARCSVGRNPTKRSQLDGHVQCSTTMIAATTGEKTTCTNCDPRQYEKQKKYIQGRHMEMDPDENQVIMFQDYGDFYSADVGKQLMKLQCVEE